MAHEEIKDEPVETHDDDASGHEPQLGTVGSAAVDTSGMSREQRRSRRKRSVRARTISVKRMTKRELEMGRVLFPETDYWKPRDRASCAEAVRPCPYVSCKHHLFTDVSSKTGAIKLNFPDLEVWEMSESCALDVADRGGTTLEDVGAIMNLTRERIRQVEVKALAKLEALDDMASIRELVDEGPIGKRRLPVLSTDELSDVRGDKKSGAKPAAKPAAKLVAAPVVGEADKTDGAPAALPSAEEVDEEFGLEPAEPADPDEADINRAVDVDDLAVDF
jgi:hypothetical protein